MIEELITFWNRELPHVTPEAHRLKHECRARWVRFHALPESKRYPENEAEYAEILRRHNAVLGELYGAHSTVFVVLPEYAESPAPTRPEKKLSDLFPVTEHWRTLAQHDEDDDEAFYWHLHAAAVGYTGTELNGLFRLVANDEVGNILIVCPTKGVVFHPYDGGADLVLASTEDRDRLKARHSAWLSSHPDGF